MEKRPRAVEDVVEMSDFWEDRRVFLTGHTGFKGSWMCATLHQLRARVAGYALPPEAPSLYEDGKGDDWVRTSHYGDLRNYRDLHSALERSGAEIVFHLAAQPLVRESYADPVGTYWTNVMGTVHVLEAVRNVRTVKALIVVTSDKCYENREWLWGYREGEAMGGYDPYSSSKGCAELVTSAYRRSFFDMKSGAARIASARAGNVIGGGDWSKDRLVPDLMRKIADGKVAEIRSPGATRPWQHVLEPISGYLVLAQCLLSERGPDFAEAWNFGPGPEGEQTVADIANAICAKWGKEAQWSHIVVSGVHEATTLRLDVAKARAFLKWEPLLTLDETIQMTVDWYKSVRSGNSAHEVTSEQVREYLGRRFALSREAAK